MSGGLRVEDARPWIIFSGVKRAMSPFPVRTVLGSKVYRSTAHEQKKGRGVRQRSLGLAVSTYISGGKLIAKHRKDRSRSICRSDISDRS